MKQAKDLLMAFLDETNMEKARMYSSFFKAWPEVVGRDAADHSAVRDCRDGVVVVAVDHPGWMQTIYMRKEKILSKLKARFPDLGIVNLRIMHGPPPPGRTVEKTRHSSGPDVGSGARAVGKPDTTATKRAVPDSDPDTDMENTPENETESMTEELEEIKNPRLYASLSRLADRLKETESKE